MYNRQLKAVQTASCEGNWETMTGEKSTTLERLALGPEEVHFIAQQGKRLLYHLHKQKTRVKALPPSPPSHHVYVATPETSNGEQEIVHHFPISLDKNTYEHRH